MCGTAMHDATGETVYHHELGTLTILPKDRFKPPWGQAKIGGTAAHYSGILGGTVPPEVKP
jgi:hypothetical protein